MARFPSGLLLGLVLSGPSAIRAQNPPESVVIVSPASVRFAGLHGAGAALVGQAGVVFSNPAALATIRHVALEGAYRTLPGDAFLATAAASWRLRQFNFGVGIRHLDVGNGTSGPGGAPIPPGQSLGVGSLVYRFPLMAVGVSAKYVRQTATGGDLTGASADVGAAIAIFDLMALGFSIQNLGGNWQSNSALRLRRLTRFGFTMNYVDPQETLRLMSTIEVQWLEGRATRAVLGVESGVVLGGKVGVVGRLGYRARRGDDDLPPVVYGVTLELGTGKLDLARENNESTGETTTRFGLRLAI